VVQTFNEYLWEISTLINHNFITDKNTQQKIEYFRTLIHLDKKENIEWFSQKIQDVCLLWEDITGSFSQHQINNLKNYISNDPYSKDLQLFMDIEQCSEDDFLQWFLSYPKETFEILSRIVILAWMLWISEPLIRNKKISYRKIDDNFIQFLNNWEDCYSILDNIYDEISDPDLKFDILEAIYERYIAGQQMEK